MKKTLAIGALFLLMSCGGAGGIGSGDSGVLSAPSANGPLNDVLKVLASNVLVGTAQAADGVDTTTKVLASNVVLDRSWPHDWSI